MYVCQDIDGNKLFEFSGEHLPTNDDIIRVAGHSYQVLRRVWHRVSAATMCANAPLHLSGPPILVLEKLL